ncbi:hypothetical protein [Streptomyces pinistramenti]|uniref:hypothetical protein n=1 Tax=Streptomyces pinistramenti TaxID=2884812 RepID=UPI001D06CE11|nr:hypothetical protein [Streptomyces pinistramenti]MCB5910812.1 hypothetical protein [Streptomyces pinistramenti]
MPTHHYVRFQSATRHRNGHFPGVFALVNNLAEEGRLTPAQEHFRRTHNDWYDANFLNPSTIDPDVYDRDLHPGAASWFKSTSPHLIARVDGYLAVLRAHRIPCHRLHSLTPGHVIYEDPDQVVVTPPRQPLRDPRHIP